MQSFFGGDPTQAHYAVRLPTYPHLKTRDEKQAAAAVDKGKLTLAGFSDKDRYFKFRVDDNRAKSLAKYNAGRYATKVAAQTGVCLEIYEGAFL